MAQQLRKLFFVFSLLNCILGLTRKQILKDALYFHRLDFFLFRRTTTIYYFGVFILALKIIQMTTQLLLHTVWNKTMLRGRDVVLSVVATVKFMKVKNNFWSYAASPILYMYNIFPATMQDWRHLLYIPYCSQSHYCLWFSRGRSFENSWTWTSNELITQVTKSPKN